jgi:hypothetical protein
LGGRLTGGSASHRGRSRAAIAVAALVAAVVLAPACSLGDRAEQADRIAASLRPLTERPVFGQVSLIATPLSAPATADTSPAAIAATQAQARIPQLVFGLALDLAHRRATVVRAAEAPATTFDEIAVFDDTAAYVVRQKTGGASSSERGWSRLEFQDLDDKGDPSLQGVANNVGAPTVGLINPAHAIELLRGVLSGSVDVQPRTKIDGIAVEHYKVRLSREDSAHELHLDEHEWDARRQALRLLGVKADVMKAEVWLTTDGRLQRVEIVLPVRPSRRLKVDLALRFDLAAAGGEAPAVVLPKADDVLTVDSPAELVRALRPRSS